MGKWRFGASEKPNSSSMAYNTTMAHNHLLWRTTVPYLIGGVTAMLILVAIALAILACSYWRTIIFSGGGNISDDGSLVALTEKHEALPENGELNVAVIMAGEKSPTSLAKPVSLKTVKHMDK